MKQNKLDVQWLDEIRQTMADHEEELPADGWEKIAAAMGAAEEVQPEVEAEQPEPMFGRKQSHIVPLWLRRAAVAALIGSIGAGGMYYFSEAPGSDDPILTEVEQTTEITPPETTAASDSGSEQLAEVTPLLAKSIQFAKIQRTENKSLDENLEEVLSNKDAISEFNTEPASETITELASEIITEPASEPEKPSETFPDMRKEEQTVLLAMETGSDRRKAIDRSWNMGVRLGRNGSTDFDFGEKGNYTEMQNSPSLSNPAPSDSTSQRAMTRALTRGAEQPEKKDEVLESENHQSWSVGISVSKQLNGRLSLESGLVYTYLSSDVTMQLSGRQHQHLHYLGIPLELNISLAENEHWQFYTDVGTMLEHSLYGKRGSTNLHLNDWQWSMNGGLGLQYKFTKHMGLYVEPGVNYYFSNGSDVPSLRSESPVSFNLQIGVRFGL